MDNYDLKKIKKHYGERFAKLCRELFPTYLDKEGLLYNTLINVIEPNETLYDDILPIKDRFSAYIHNIIDYNNRREYITTDKTPEQLLDEAGYILMPECKTEEDIQQYKYLYKSNEEICTFQGGRLNSCRVWFAIKKNATELKRKDFTYPQRQDEYGTSVISIQFTKGKQSFLSIKNRYNHSVENPDATFNNNLDEIIPGLTNAFIKTYDINLLNKDDVKFNMASYIFANNGKMYKYYNFISEDERRIFFCENNIIIENGEVKKYSKDKCIFADNYIIDLERKVIIDYLKTKNNNEFIDFPDASLNKIASIKAEKVVEDNIKYNIVNITPENGLPVVIKIKNNFINSYSNPNETEIGNGFLHTSKNIKNIELPNAKKIGDYFLSGNCTLENIDVHNVESIGDGFLQSNFNLNKIDLENVKKIGNYALIYNKEIQSVNMPKVESIGYSFLQRNENIKELNIPTDINTISLNTYLKALIEKKKKQAEITENEI